MTNGDWTDGFPCGKKKKANFPMEEIIVHKIKIDNCNYIRINSSFWLEEWEGEIEKVGRQKTGILEERLYLGT